MALEKVRNGKFIHRLSDKANPAQKYPVPQQVLDDPNWLKVDSIAEFRKLFSPKDWKIITQFKDYAVFIHKSHAIFSVLPEFKKVSKNIIEKLQATEKLQIIDFLDIRPHQLANFSHFELVEIAKEVAVKITIKDDYEIEIERPEFVSTTVAPKKNIEPVKTPSEFTKKDLGKLDLFGLNELCSKKGIDTKGITKKEGLINLLLGGK